MNGDRRRRQYVPLYVHFMSGHTGTEIHSRFGNDGLLAWISLLAAAKRSPEQGSIQWVTESDGWRILEFHEPPISFTFEEFIKSLGAMHLTRTSKRGRLRTTQIRAWNEWNSTIKREHDAEKKRRKRAQTTGDNRAPFGGTEGEGEYERTKTSDSDPQTVSQSRWPECPHCGRTEWRDRDDHDNHVNLLCPQLDPEWTAAFHANNDYRDYADIVNEQLDAAKEANP
jgi:hypothetical protein